MNLKDRVVVITGASSGVGAATAVLCAEAGASVVVNYRTNAEGAKATAEDCKEAGGRAIVVQGDVAEDAACRGIAHAAVQEFGRIDYLVNNAGTTVFCPMENLDCLSSDDFQRIFGVNTVGPFQMTRACVDELRTQPGAAVVNVSSIAGLVGTGSSVAYAASKGALLTVTKSLARVLAPRVRVNAVCPGFIEGDWLKKGLGEEAYTQAKAGWEASAPLGTTVLADDVAEAIVYLLVTARTVTGETLILDSGFHLKAHKLVRE